MKFKKVCKQRILILIKIILLREYNLLINCLKKNKSMKKNKQLKIICHPKFQAQIIYSLKFKK